jgi:hypothetical protein
VEKQNGVVDRKQKSEEQLITASCSTKATSFLKVSPTGLGSTKEKQHLRELIIQKQIETEVSLNSVQAKKIWYNMASINRVKPRPWNSSE